MRIHGGTGARWCPSGGARGGGKSWAAGEPLAVRTIEDSARALGECVGGMGNLIDPDVIVVSGSVAKAGPLWWNALRAGFEDSALQLVRSTLLVKGELGGSAPLIGAAAAARRHMEQWRE